MTPVERPAGVTDLNLTEAGAKLLVADILARAERNNPLALKAELIEEGVGPSNVHVVHEASRDIIVAANREKAEAALYFVS